MVKKFLALVGSPRPESTSGFFAQHLVDGFAARGWEAQALTACLAMRQPEKWPALEKAYREADVVGLVTPLYVDSLPAELTATLERLAQTTPKSSGRLFAVMNCGFAEASQNDTALEICRLFARDAGWRWSGGLAIGGGGMFSGQPLKNQGGKVRHITKAFDLSVAALAEGQDIPESALKGIRRSPIPAWAYFAMGNLGMVLSAAKNGNLFRIGAQPYRGKVTSE
jgi:hypothetical protein